MCDHKRRPIIHHTIDGLLDKLFGLGIDRACRFIEDEDGRIECESTSERDQLFLPDRQTGAPFAHLKLVFSVKLADEIVSPHFLGSPPDLSTVDVLSAEANIVFDRTAEKEDVLQHDSKIRPQIMQVPIADVDAV